MKFTPAQLPEILIIEPEVFVDERGFFMEVFRTKEYAEAGIAGSFVQDNHSASKRGVLRGLHYQVIRPQGKLVRVIAGEIFDVAVDLRKSSPNFGKWAGVILSSTNKSQLWIPEGFAHGFYAMSEWAEVTYKATNYYVAEWERAVLWSDPSLGIKWPLVDGRTPIVSEKDTRGKLLTEADLFD